MYICKNLLSHVLNFKAMIVQGDTQTIKWNTEKSFVQAIMNLRCSRPYRHLYSRRMQGYQKQEPKFLEESIGQKRPENKVCSTLLYTTYLKQRFHNAPIDMCLIYLYFNLDLQYLSHIEKPVVDVNIDCRCIIHYISYIWFMYLCTTRIFNKDSTLMCRYY